MSKTTRTLFIHLAVMSSLLAVFQTGVRADDGSRPKRVDTEREARGADETGADFVAGHIGTPIGAPFDLDGNAKVEGIAFREDSRELFVLDDVVNDVDGDGLAETGEQIQIYAYRPEASTLVLRSSFTIPASATGEVFSNGRGLALAEGRDGRVLYTLSSTSDGTKDEDGKDNFVSTLWRIDRTQPESIKAQTLDLNRDIFDLRHAEVFDVACDKSGRVYISLDASKRAPDLSTQRTRGILRLQAGSDFQGDGSAVAHGQTSVRMLPADGKSSSHHNLGLTVMEMDGHEYLIGTIEELSNNEDQEIYVAEAETGRGLFEFDAPPTTGTLNTERRLAFGAGFLWVGEQREGPDQVRRVVIQDNVYQPRIGPKHPRRIQFTLTSETVGPSGQDHGFIIHSLGHPLGTDIKPSQGTYSDSYSLQLEFPRLQASGEREPPTASIEHFSYLPLNDPSSSARVTQVKYLTSSTGPGLYKTVFKQDFWTREYRHFVYPHLASNSLGALKGSDFELGHLKKGDPAIKDSLPRFHWTHQDRIFEDFIGRVKVHIREKYGVAANLTNPYWAARNVLEYIADNYNYPAPAASEDGSGDSRGNVVDPDNFHEANGPAVYKMIMTDPRFDYGVRKRRMGCMAAGGVFLAVMRYMGFPARWIGTSPQGRTDQDNPYATEVFYDLNRDGMFNGDDYMDAIHGHFTTEVYLGPGYGWQRFDATPYKPDDRESDGLDYEDFAHLHTRASQYQMMTSKVTAGHGPRAVASSLGVGYNPHFFMHDAENSPDCHVKSICHEDTGIYTSACRGAGSYDFVSIYEHPQKVMTRYDLDARVRWRPSLTFDVVVADGQPVVGENRVQFSPQGPWALFEPDARVEIVLRIADGETITHRVLKEDIRWDEGSETIVIPEGISGESIHIQVRKIGVEDFIGGASPEFSL